MSESGEFWSLINNVLETSKIESGRIPVTLKPLDFHHTLRKIEEISRSSAESKGLALIVDWTQDVLYYLKTDKSKLCQVLLNLLSNAVNSRHRALSSCVSVIHRLWSASLHNVQQMCFT